MSDHLLIKHCSLEPYGGAYVPQFSPAVIIDEPFKPTFCKKIIKNLGNPISSGVYDANQQQVVDTYHRSSKALTLSRDLYDKMAELMTAEVSKHSVEKVGRVATLAEPMQFLSYDEADKGHFLPHTDNAYWDGKGEFQYTSPHRHLTCIAYLNSDYEGGELVLHTVHKLDGSMLRIKPTTGQMVLFPSDIRFVHEVTPVTRGKRYAVVGWFSLK